MMDLIQGGRQNRGEESPIGTRNRDEPGQAALEEGLAGIFVGKKIGAIASIMRTVLYPARKRPIFIKPLYPHSSNEVPKGQFKRNAKIHSVS